MYPNGHVAFCFCRKWFCKGDAFDPQSIWGRWKAGHETTTWQCVGWQYRWKCDNMISMIWYCNILYTISPFEHEYYQQYDRFWQIQACRTRAAQLLSSFVHGGGHLSQLRILHANISCVRNVVDNNGQMATDSQTWPRGAQAADDLYKKHADLLVELSVFFAVCQLWVFVAMPVVQNARLWSTNALVAPRHRLESRNSWRSCSDSLIFDPTSQCLQMWHFWGFFSQ